MFARTGLKRKCSLAGYSVEHVAAPQGPNQDSVSTSTGYNPLNTLLMTINAVSYKAALKVHMKGSETEVEQMNHRIEIDLN